MTDLGKELLSQANPIIEKIEQEIIKGISSKEIELAIQILRQVQANVNESVGVGNVAWCLWTFHGGT